MFRNAHLASIIRMAVAPTLLTFAAPGVCPASAATLTFDTRVLSGQPAPGTAPGVTYTNLSNPVINAAGEVAFLSDLSGNGVTSTNSRGIWSGAEGANPSLVARIGDAAPGAPAGIVYGVVGVPVLNSQGESAYLGLLSGPGLATNQERGVWSESAGTPGPVAVSGNAAAGTPAGLVYSVLGGPVLNDAGQTAFVSFLSGNGIPEITQAGIWSTPVNTPSAPRLIARTGSPAPGIAAGVVYGDLTIPALNPAGQTAYFGRLTGSGVNSTNDAAIWSEAADIPSLIARTGEPAPGTGVTYLDLGTPALNAAGQLAFTADLVGPGVLPSNRESLWSHAGANANTDPTLVVRASDPAPGAPSGAVFNSFGDPVLNAAGTLAFRGELLGGGVAPNFSSGIWTAPAFDPGSGIDPDLVARASDPAPGTPAGVVFKDFSSPAINTAGQLAFRAVLDGTDVDSDNGRGIWATDPNGQLTLVLREGDLFDVDDDPAQTDFRTVEDFDLIRQTGNQDGRRSSFNDAGQLAFAASFTDGSSGIFVANIINSLLDGDYNADGFVSQGDLDLVLLNWGNAALPAGFDTSAIPGGGPFDNLISQNELDGVLLNWGNGSPPNVAIPEPASAIAIMFGSAAFLRRPKPLRHFSR